MTYHSLCGSFAVERFSYRQSAVRNGPTVVPLELAAELVERATPALLFRVALGDAQCPGRQWEQQMHASHREPPSRSTLERIAKKLGKAVREAAPQILPAIRAAEVLAERAHAVSIGFDRTTIPMEERWRDNEVGEPVARRRNKPYLRKPPRPFDVNYRMGYVGTVTVSDADGETLQSYKYACSADEDPAAEVAKMLADVAHLMAQSRAVGKPIPLGVLQDGAPEMWRLVEEGLNKYLPGIAYDKAIDRYHLNERLAESVKILGLSQGERQRLMRQWNCLLDIDNSAIDMIEKRLNRDKSKRKTHRISAANAAIFQSHLTYIKNNKCNMRYADLRRKGLPVGSGATEGACKSLIMIRAKGCGQRWLAPGVNSVLTLRGLYLSDRLRPAWNAFLNGRVTNIRPAA